MPDLIRLLCDDHRNIQHLLDLIERQVAVAQAGEDADYRLLHDAMVYITNYPDFYHHPAEDRIVAHLRERDPRAEETLTRVEADHRRLQTMGDSLRTQLASVLEDQVMRRDALAERIRDYVHAMREHMEAEERFFFPRAERALNDADWYAIEREANIAADPLFGAVVQGEYRGLYHYLTRAQSDSAR